MATTTVTKLTNSGAVSGLVSADSNGLQSTVTNTLPAIATTSKTIYDNSPTATDDIPFNIDTQGAITLKAVECLNNATAGNTDTFNITWGTTRSATTYSAFTSGQVCTATSTASVLTPNGSTTIAAGSIVRLVNSAASSTGITVEIEY
jgi:hypothetical protein